MLLVFVLRLAFDRGAPVPSAKTFVTARGELSVVEEKDATFRRVVRTATFRRVDDGPPVPALRDVEMLHWGGTAFVLRGVEEVADDKLSRPRLYAHTWQLIPEAFDELTRAELQIGRLTLRLHQAGVEVRKLPNGDIHIAGETWPDGSPKLNQHSRSP